MPHPLYFIRHGQTDWNNEARLQGQTDTEINATGMAQATANGTRLAALLGEHGHDLHAVSFVSSPLRRCRQTMRRVRAACGLDPHDFTVDDRLREISFGDWEGMTRPEIAEQDGDNYARYRADRWGYRPPNAESYEDLSARVADWLNAIACPTVCVSHGGVLRTIQGLTQTHDTAAIPKLAIPQDQIFVAANGTTSWH